MPTVAHVYWELCSCLVIIVLAEKISQTVLHIVQYIIAVILIYYN